MATSASTLTSLYFFSSSLFLSSPSAKFPTCPSLYLKASSKPTLSISSRNSPHFVLHRRKSRRNLPRPEFRSSRYRSSRDSPSNHHRPPKPAAKSVVVVENRIPKRKRGGHVPGQLGALSSPALSSAAENTIVVEEFGDKFEKPKTKEFIEALKMDVAENVDILNCDNMVLTLNI